MRVNHRGNRLGRDGRYHLDRQLSQDPLGSLWLAKDVNLGTSVTIRVLRNELAADERFQRSLRTVLRPIARLEHPNVPGLIASRGSREGQIQFLVMRAFEGESIAQRLLRVGPLGPAMAARVSSQVRAALDAAHEIGLVHGGVGPHSVVLTARGARVIDFGLPTALRQVAREAGASTGERSPGPDVDVMGGDPDQTYDVRSLELLTQRMLSARGSAVDELAILVDLVLPVHPTPTTNGAKDGATAPSRPPPRPTTRARPAVPAPVRTGGRHPFSRVGRPFARASKAVASVARGAASVVRAVGRVPRRGVVSFARGARSALRAVGRVPRRAVASFARGAGTVVRFVGRVPRRAVASSARGAGTVVRSVGRVPRRAVASLARGAGPVVRSVGRVPRRAVASLASVAGGTVSPVRTMGRVMRGAAASVAGGTGSVVRSVGRVPRMAGARPLALGAVLTVVVTAASIAFVSMRPSSEAPVTVSEVDVSPSAVTSPTSSPEVVTGVMVPDVDGLSATEALRVLEESGFVVADAEPTPGPPGEVVGTNPPMSEFVDFGTPITLFVGATEDRFEPEF